MNKIFTTKRLCRAAVIAALYTVLTYAFWPLAFGPFQFRPAEALCILPLFYAEAVPALAIGCLLSNIFSNYLLYDLIFGSLTSLVAAFITYLVGRYFKNDKTKLFLGGLAPVLLNALIIPLFIVFVYNGGQGETVVVAYFSSVLSMLVTQSIWIYGLGAPLYYNMKRLRQKNASSFLN